MKFKNLRKQFFLIFIMLNCFLLFAEEETFPYKINNVFYLSTGNTKVSAFKRNIEVDTKNTFKNKEEFLKYLSTLTQEIKNLRLVEDIKVTYEFKSFENNCNIIDISIMFSDTKHLLILPKPSYDSNNGFELKIKMKDTNFLGLLNTFNFDFNGSYALDKLKGDRSAAFGVNFSYDFPFEIYDFNFSWDNDASFKWTLGHSQPEFSYETGFTVEYPFINKSLEIKIHEGIIRDEEFFKYGDEMYFKNIESISLPVTIAKIKGSKLLYIPSIKFEANSDSDGINIENYDLSSPLISLQQEISYSKIDWLENMRNGFYFDIKSPIGWNFQKSDWVRGVILNLQYYTCNSFISFSSRIYSFIYQNNMEKTGEKIRGVLDNQLYTDSHQLALRTDVAFILNLDMPLHIITTDWYNWGYKLFGSYKDMSKFAQVITFIPYKLFNIADFELQLSPFIDLALLNNSSTQRIFNLQDGFYAAGIEVLVFPAKWKSFVVRASLGYDLGKKLFPSKLETSWRENVAAREFSFGLGLHY